jgi:hypothetical protein
LGSTGDERKGPSRAVHTRKILKAAGRQDVCGDDPAVDYKLVLPKPHPNAVATIRLCDDCRTIKKGRGEFFESFFW